jgi:LemA protein
MDVYLKQRWDYVPNLVETVKGYMKHEAETLEKIISLRTNSYDGMSAEEKINANNELSRGLGRLLAVSEAYPELKSSANFQDLSTKLETMEGHISNSRKYYNGAVKSYNITVQTFPNFIVAKIFKFETMKMFEINVEERENVKVKF